MLASAPTMWARPGDSYLGIFKMCLGIADKEQFYQSTLVSIQCFRTKLLVQAGAESSLYLCQFVSEDSLEV